MAVFLHQCFYCSSRTVCACLQGGSPRQVTLMASVHTQLHVEACGRCHQPRERTHMQRSTVWRSVHAEMRSGAMGRLSGFSTYLPASTSLGCVYMGVCLRMLSLETDSTCACWPWQWCLSSWIPSSFLGSTSLALRGEFYCTASHCKKNTIELIKEWRS